MTIVAWITENTCVGCACGMGGAFLGHVSISGSVCKGHEVWFKSQPSHLFASCVILGNGLSFCVPRFLRGCSGQKGQ